jgi:hypothetical protein
LFFEGNARAREGGRGRDGGRERGGREGGRGMWNKQKLSEDKILYVCIYVCVQIHLIKS